MPRPIRRTAGVLQSYSSAALYVLPLDYLPGDGVATWGLSSLLGWICLNLVARRAPRGWCRQGQVMEGLGHAPISHLVDLFVC